MQSACSVLAISGSLMATAPLFAQNDARLSYSVPAQSLESALYSLSKKNQLNMVLPHELLQGKQSRGLEGTYSITEALDALLKDTSLEYEFKSNKLIVVKQKSNPGADQGLAEASDAGGKDFVLEEIIVTAEKRVQNVQDVPVAITAYTSKGLERRGIVTPQDLQFSVPGLSIGEAALGVFSARVAIRGVGQENSVPGGDPGVPMHVDGHYRQATAYVLRDMFDVERVEVQRGPQGTLYGRNAIGGNINIITKRPSDELEGLLRIDAGNYDKRLLQAVVSGPLSDTVRGRLAISDKKQDGYVKNVGVSAKDLANADYTSIRGAIDADLTEAFSVSLDGYWFDDNGTSATRRTVGGVIVDPFEISTNTPTNTKNKSQGLSLDIDWDLGSVRFKSLSAYDDTVTRVVLDEDQTDSRLDDVYYEASYEVFTQELQLQSNGESAAEWVVGAFYYDETSLNLIDVLRETGPDSARSRVYIPNDVHAISKAVFGQIEYPFTDNLSLVAGLRYTRDEKDAHSLLQIGSEAADLPPVESAFDFHNVWDEVTGKLGINYTIADDKLIYASYSRGYKAGGIYYTSPPYDPEYIDAYEIGLKSQWFDNRLQANISAFYYDYTNKQDFQQDDPAGGSYQIKNASSAKSKGFEAEIMALVTEQLSLDFSLGYLDATFSDYQTADPLFLDRGVQDLAGNRIAFSPEWKVHAGAQYEWMLGNYGNLMLRADFSWTADQWTNGLNRRGQGVVILHERGDLIPSYYIANANLQWESEEGDWQVELYARNLTNEAIVVNSFVSTAAVSRGEIFSSYSAPRTYGLRVTRHF